MVKYSSTEENYIKAIFQLQAIDSNVSTNDIAKHLHTKAATVTDMLKKLKLKKLIEYKPYYGVHLTKNGNKHALQIIRKHRLWEYFLVNKLNFNWDEVHDVAEELEHISSNKLIDKLEQYLGNPKYDPHGDPIPNKIGVMPVTNNISLTQIPINKKATISLVNSQHKQLLGLLQQKKINIGSSIKVVNKFEFDDSLEVQINQQTSFNISHKMAETLFVTLN